MKLKLTLRALAISGAMSALVVPTFGMEAVEIDGETIKGTETGGLKTSAYERSGKSQIRRNFMAYPKDLDHKHIWREELCRERLLEDGLDVTNKGTIKMSLDEEAYRKKVAEVALWLYKEVFFLKARFPEDKITNNIVGEDPVTGEKYYRLDRELCRIGNLKSWMTVSPSSDEELPNLLPAFNVHLCDAINDLYLYLPYEGDERKIVIECRRACEIFQAVILAFLSHPQVCENITDKSYLGTFLDAEKRKQDKHLQDIYFNQMKRFYGLWHYEKGEANILIGDLCYFKNHPDYLKKHPVGRAMGEHALCVGFDAEGNRRYLIFGDKEPRTAEFIFRSLADAYMEPTTTIEQCYQKINKLPPFEDTDASLDVDSLTEKIKKAQQGFFKVSQLEVPSKYHYEKGNLIYVDF